MWVERHIGGGYWTVRCAQCGPIHSTYDHGYALAAVGIHRVTQHPQQEGTTNAH